MHPRSSYPLLCPSSPQARSLSAQRERVTLAMLARATWRRLRAAPASLLCVLALAGSWPNALAAVVFNGWNAGHSSSSFGWSSDLFGANALGLPDIACVYPGVSAICSDPRYPHGTTTPPNLAPFSLIKGQQVQTRVSRPWPMLASMTADVQAAGDIEDQVTHLRFDHAVAWLSGYGLFTQSDARNLLVFGGVGANTALYYYVEWAIDADDAAPGALMNYSVEINGSNPAQRGSGLRPQDLRGSYAGSTLGASVLSPQFSFSLYTPAGAPRTTAAASLDIWMTFSSEPVFSLPAPGGSVPEPGTLPLLLAGALCAAVGAWRRREGAAKA
jgi:PEP-CTERM motif